MSNSANFGISRPRATFVARLQPSQLPAEPLVSFRIQSTIVQMESSSTDDPRHKGACQLRTCLDFMPAAESVGHSPALRAKKWRTAPTLQPFRLRRV
jgi:hypothetical protein